MGNDPALVELGLRRRYAVDMSFKRGQIEGALSAVFGGPGRTARDRLKKPIDPDLVVRLKRLLQLDRRWGQENPKQAGSLAFYDAIPGGKGTDIVYSAQRAFNLGVAVLLMEFGFKQAEVVERVALLQPKLKQAFDRASRTLRTHGAEHDRSRIDTATGKKLPLLTTLSEAAQQPDTSIFLLVSRFEASDRIEAWSGGKVKVGQKLMDPELCWGHEDLSRHFQGNLDHTLRGVFVIELSELAARLNEVLPLLPTTQRGRRRAAQKKQA